MIKTLQTFSTDELELNLTFEKRELNIANQLNC